MATAVPARAGRTADAFRLATAAFLERLLSIGPANGSPSHLEFIAAVSGALEDSPLHWDSAAWRQFHWWCHHVIGPRFLPTVSGDALTTGLRDMSVAGPTGFMRLIDNVHLAVGRPPEEINSRNDTEDRIDLCAADVLREVFGSPLAPGKWSATRVHFQWPRRLLPADWRTDTVVTLADQMWRSRDFSVMPILADALQDAGCTREDVLEHCRDAAAIHCRGCWVLDAILAPITTPQRRHNDAAERRVTMIDRGAAGESPAGG
jgi:hypothetical protein